MSMLPKRTLSWCRSRLWLYAALALFAGPATAARAPKAQPS